MTLITIRALIRWAAGRMPASASAMVRGELAVVEFEFSNRLSSYGSKMPIKNIVPVCVSWHDRSWCSMRRTNVENQDTPENLLNSTRNGSSRIL